LFLQTLSLDQGQLFYLKNTTIMILKHMKKLKKVFI